jgi:uncharacterized protein
VTRKYDMPTKMNGQNYPIKIRKPGFDFSQTPAHWAASAELAQIFNAPSVYIPYLERFFNQVMAKAAGELKSESAETSRLREDIRLFIRQEAQHYTAHGAFNAIFSREGYEIAEFERHVQAEFDRLVATKSFKFLCAYCEGAEAMGPPSALIWMDEIADLLEGARPEVVELWKWHLLEEFEHRNVCHDVYKALFGGYFMRVYGLLYQLFHLGGLGRKLRRSLLERDRAQMTPAERKASRKRERAVELRLARMLLPRVFKILLPGYSPRKAREPRLLASFVASLDSKVS